MKKRILMLALASVASVAMAGKPVVIKDTRAGTSISGGPASGVLLTREGDACSLTEYKHSPDKPNRVVLPVIVHRMYPCDARGNPVSGNVNEVRIGDGATAITRGTNIQQSTKGTGNTNSVVIE